MLNSLLSAVLIATVVLTATTPAPAKSAKALAKQTAHEIEAGEQAKAQILGQNQEIQGTPFNTVMNRVFEKLVAVPEVASRQFPYEIHLIQSDEANAFCTPGGKVFVLSGFTSILREDDNLWAAVLGHEIAHAVRSHVTSQEKQAKGLSTFTKVLGSLGNLAPGLSRAGDLDKYAKAADVAGKVSLGMGVLNPFLMRKFSRNDEADADAQGMLYMAKAGYDPAAAVRFHKELVERFGDSKAFTTFVSTHPRESVRIAALEKLMPQVRAQADGSTSSFVGAADGKGAMEESHDR